MGFDLESGWLSALIVQSKGIHSSGGKDIFDIDSNIHVGADYLAELFKDHEDTAVVIALYHGEANAEEKAKQNKLSEYTKKILEKAASLERAHGK